MARRLAQIVAFSLAALASCYLGLLVSHLLWDAPHLLVAAFTDAEVVAYVRFGFLNLVPRPYVLPPAEASPLAFAVYTAGPIAVAVVVLAACLRFIETFAGWLRLTILFSGFWTCLLLTGAAVGYAGRGAGPLAAVTSMADIGASTVGRWIVAAAVVMACLLCLTRLLQAIAGETEAAAAQRAARVTLWFLLPVVALSAALSFTPFRIGRLQPFGGAFPLLLMAVLPALAAIRFRRTSIHAFHPAIGGAVASVAVAAVSLAVIAAYPSMARQPEQPEFDSLSSRHWRISFEQGAFSPAERQSWVEAADRRLEEFSRRLAIPLDGVQLRSQVFLSTKSKRAATRESRDDQPFTLSNEPLMLHQLLAPDRTLADPRGEPLLLMVQAWGPAASQDVADAIARYAGGSFLKHPLSGYACQIACEERPYALTEVLGISPHYVSPLVRDALSGAWVESLVEDQGPQVLPRVYRAIPAEEGRETIAGALAASWSELEAAWRSYLKPTDATCESPPALDPVLRSARSADAPADRVHRGVSFSHEVGGDWGYGSDSAQRELEKIRQIGANGVAIMPYAFTRAPEETAIRFRTDETDARIVRVIGQARQAGLRVMLKPHLWGSGFTGDMKFRSGEDFRIWWQSYRSWLLHFARMAELYDVELLALGNELGGLTVHEQAWRDLIRDVRRVYRGELTYASHWDGEFERVPFWDQLDYIGVNAYFPLAGPGETPRSDSRIAKIRASLAAVAQRYQKPVLFTEVGYSSIEGAAVEPWAEHSGAVDVQVQAKCYEVLFESFAKQPWFAGTYWWKWPSHGRGGPYDLSHRPNGKPAMEVLQRWFRGDDPTKSTQSRGR